MVETEQGVRVVDRRKKAHTEELRAPAKVQTSTLKPAIGGTQTADDARAAPADASTYFSLGDRLDSHPGAAVVTGLGRRGLALERVIEDGTERGWRVVVGDEVPAEEPAAAPPKTEAAPAEKKARKSRKAPAVPAPEPEPAYTAPEQSEEPLEDVFCMAPVAGVRAICGCAVMPSPSGLVCVAGHGEPPTGSFWEVARILRDAGVPADEAAELMWAEEQPMREAWARWEAEAHAAARAVLDEAVSSMAPLPDATPAPPPADFAEGEVEYEPISLDGARAVASICAASAELREQLEASGIGSAPPRCQKCDAPLVEAADRPASIVEELTEADYARLGRLYVLALAFECSPEYVEERVREVTLALRRTVLRSGG